MTFVKSLLVALFGVFFGVPKHRTKSRRRRSGGRTSRHFRPRLEGLVEILEERIPLAVDIAPFALVAPATVTAGSTINASVGVANNGSTATGGFYLNIFASSDANINSSDVLLKTAWQPGINPWSSWYWTESMTLPSWMVGTYYIGVVSDPWNWVAETNEYNNSVAASSATIITAPVQIDLAPSYVSAPSNATAGGTANVSVGVRNLGSTAAGGYYVNIHASNDANITASDVLLKTVWQPGIGAWSSQGWTESVSLPSWMVGTYFIGAVTDPWNWIAETNEWNNAVAASNATTIAAAVQIDLNPSFVNAPSSATAGGTASISVGVRNLGSTAAGGYYVNIYASNDANITASDVLLKTVWQPGIGGWSSQAWTESVNLPSWMVGTYFIGAVIDPWNWITETNEWNNAVAASNVTTILAPVKIDLSPYFVGVPSTATAGSTVNVAVAVANYGNTASGGFYLNVYASADANITSGDILLKTIWRPSINAYSGQMLTETISLPSWMIGKYYIGSITDPWNWIPETNESNNAVAAYAATTVLTSIAWGKSVSTDFKARVIQVATNLGVDVNNLMAVMAFESAETFSPSIQNPVSGAVGLIQFTAQTAQNLGTTLAALKNMTSVQQLDYVERYLSPWRGRLGTLADLYMAVLWPSAIGQPDDTTLFSRGSTAYSQNSGLDLNGDGRITKNEATSPVSAKLTKGFGSQYYG